MRRATTPGNLVARAKGATLQITFTTNPSAPGIQAVTQQTAEGGQGAGSILPNHPTQSATTVRGWAAILFAIPFLAAGAGVLAAALDMFPVHNKNAPDWLLGLVGSFFFLAGASVIVHGVRDVLRKAAYKQECMRHPGEPWYADYHWHKEGFRFSAFKAMLGRFLAALFWTSFLIPFFWVGATVRGAWIFLVGATISALLGLIFWYRWAQMLGDLLRYGNSFLQYDQFPFFLGSKLNARLRAPQHVADLNGLTLTLRCVMEKYVTTNTGSSRSTQVVCYELYKDQATLPRERLAALAGGDISIEFRLPSDQAATSLISKPPIYWEIEARGTAQTVNYEAYFLVPVYKPQ